MTRSGVHQENRHRYAFDPGTPSDLSQVGVVVLAIEPQATRFPPCHLFLGHPGAQLLHEIGRLKAEFFHTILHFWYVHEQLPK
jgi:hypothetical protein